MPVVYLPLNSASASGAFGETIVYQGTTVRKYVVPNDPRTDAQVDVRNMFYDVTKMTKAAGTYARAAFSTLFGSRWYTAIFGRVTANTLEKWNEADLLWDALSPEEQASWTAGAPYLATYNEPGRVFHNVYVTVYQWAYGESDWQFEMPFYTMENLPDVITWWTQDYGNIGTAGKWDDDASWIQYPSGWTVVSDASALDGSYHKLSAGGPQGVGFDFLGQKVSFIYKVGLGLGSFEVQIDGVAVGIINQAAGTTAYQQTMSFPLARKGLHHVWLQILDGNDKNLDGVRIVGTVSSGSIPKVDGAVMTIGVIEATEQVVTPGTPTEAVSKLYFKSDNKLYKLSSDGVETEVGASVELDLSAAWPVGSIFTSVVSTNPATLLGFGTWTTFAAGRVLVGIDAGQTEFDTVEETGGAKTHTLISAEMPSHTHVQDAHQHTVNARVNATGFGSSQMARGSATGTTNTANTSDDVATNQNTGGGGAHNNLQPYIVVYMWKRTA